MKIPLPSLLIALVLSCQTYPASANVGWISSGGAVHLLSNNATVSMQSEVVNVTVSKNEVRADCRFVFVNQGPACTIRMGFPNELGGPLPKAELCDSFGSFVSFVDDKEVPTELVGSDDPDEPNVVWHAHDVSFPANGTHVVRDVYTVSPGFGIVSEKGHVVKQIAYVLHTAASWHAPIQTAEINFTFDATELRSPFKIVALSSLKDKDVMQFHWRSASRRALVYWAPKAPSISNQSIRFEFKDFRPSKESDIELFYGVMTRSEAEKFVDNLQSLDKPGK